MDFGLLGDVTARQNGDAVQLNRQQRAVLAVLLFRANTVVSRVDIARLAWGPQPGDTPRTIDDLIVSYVSRLRTAFQEAGGDVELTARPPGFLLAVAAETVDWHRFVRLVEDADRARAAADPADAVRWFWQGLELWRGPALADVGPSLDPVRVEMEARRLGALESLATIELTRGGAGRVLPLLTEAVHAHPTREGLVALQIRALTATGRRDEAVAAYRRSHRLSNGLGLGPDPAVEDAYRELLSGQPSRPSGPPFGPSQLPLDTSAFTGREVELEQLMAFAPGFADLPRAVGSPVPGVGGICVVNGMAGVGKTALAVHAAHQLAPWFSDGTLYLDLHGLSPNVSRVEPAEALDRLLRSIGVAGELIPPHLDDRAALYRDRLAGKRLLIVLDDAYRAEQVRPLIPGSAGCLVLITSRRRLTALDDAYPLPLVTLPAGDARTLLRRVAGPDRTRGQEDDVETIIELCAGLPMAIRMVASQLRNHPAWRVQHLATLLSEAQDQPWDLADEERSIVGAFTVSYRDSTAVQQRMFRLLGLAPGRDIDAHGAAALLDASPWQATRALQGLLDAHLLEQQVEGRYRLHDLMRRFAADLARSTDSTVDSRAALARLLDHQLHAAAAAVNVLHPHERSLRPQLAPPRSQFPGASTPPDARAWLDAERINLIAGAGYAASDGWPDHARDMAGVLYRYLLTSAHYADALELDRLALPTVLGQNNRAGEGAALDRIGNAYRRLGRYEEALHHFRAAVAAQREVGDEAREAVALTSLAVVLGLHGRYTEALYQLQRGLILSRRLGNLAVEANIITNLANVYVHSGNYGTALDHYQRALLIFTEIGNRVGEGTALANLGEIHNRLDERDLALAHLRQALEVCTEVGDRVGRATALTNLGAVHEREGDYDRALDCHEQAQEGFQATGHRQGQGEVLLRLGCTFAGLRQYADSLAHLGRALVVAREIGDYTLRTSVLNGLGRTLTATGAVDRAVASHQAALTLADRIGNRFERARALEGIAECHAAAGEHDLAARHWHAATSIYRGLGLPEAAGLHNRLAER